MILFVRHVSHNIVVPDMSARYVERRDRARHHKDEFRIEYHYRVYIYFMLQ